MSKVFHEGLKSWSCCQNVNKPVLDFDDFMKIPVRPSWTDLSEIKVCSPLPQTCTTGLHSTEAPKVEAPKPSADVNLKVTEGKDGKEVYSQSATPATSLPVSTGPRDPPPPPEEEEDDLSAPVVPGTTCKRKGCGKSYVSDEVSRNGDSEEAVCVYHPMPVSIQWSRG